MKKGTGRDVLQYFLLMERDTKVVMTVDTVLIRKENRQHKRRKRCGKGKLGDELLSFRPATG